MKQFAKRAALFLVLQLLLLVLLFLVYQPDSHSFLAAGLDKMEHARAEGPGKVVLVGGSSVAFGFQSDILQRAFGRAVLNLGGQASQGLEYRLREAGELLEDGDTVIMSLEYQMLGEPVGLGLTLWRTLEVVPGSLRRMGPEEFKVLLDDAHLFLNHVLKRSLARVEDGKWPSPPPPYRREGFNKEGDMVDHYLLPAPGVGNELFRVTVSESHLQSVIARLAEFKAECKKKNIRVFFFPPAIPEPRLRENAEALHQIDAALKAAFPGAVLAGPEQVVQPETQFFNSNYHLTKAGGTVNTERLAEYARVIFPEERSPGSTGLSQQ